MKNPQNPLHIFHDLLLELNTKGKLTKAKQKKLDDTTDWINYALRMTKEVYNQIEELSPKNPRYNISLGNQLKLDQLKLIKYKSMN